MLGSVVLAEEISLGRYGFSDNLLLELYRVIGAVIIAIGLYSLVWGKSKDHLTQAASHTEALERHRASKDAPPSSSLECVTIVGIPSTEKS